MIVAGMTNVINPISIPCRYGPILATKPSTSPPNLATSTNDIAASKNGVVSLPVTFRNPTINPRTINTVVATVLPVGLKIPTIKAITTPNINAQLPTFASILVPFAIHITLQFVNFYILKNPYVFINFLPFRFQKIYKQPSFTMIGEIMIEWIITIVVVVILLILILMYNRFVVLRNRIDNAWAQIDVQLKRRFDLIPNLVETVKGYAKHEKKVFTEVTKARTALMEAKTIPEKAKANNMLSETLKSLFAVAENYPKLEASENFRMLQEELSGTESKIACARQAYNDSVLSYNNGTQQFPGSMIAGMFNFKERDFFKTDEVEKKNVKVAFE